MNVYTLVCAYAVSLCVCVCAYAHPNYTDTARLNIFIKTKNKT